MKSALISPGNYDISYNQNYLMAKLNMIDIYWSWFNLLATAILFILLIVYIVYKFQNKPISVLSINNDSLNKKLFNDFTSIMKQYEDTVQCMGLPEKEKERLFFSDARKMAKLLIKNEKFIYQNYSMYELKRWHDYKDMLLKEPIDTKE